MNLNRQTHKIGLRVIVLALALLPFFYLPGFYDHFYAHFTGSIGVITQQWHIVALNILLFTAFLIPLSFRRKANWGEYGLVGAFFISLFVEMYGIPLSISLVSRHLFPANSTIALNGIKFAFFGVGFVMTTAMIYGALLMIVGGAFILWGWRTLYKNIKQTGLVTTGIYSYSRHPQYLGFLLIVAGWFIGWPTPLTALFTPVLAYKYITLCKTEEKEVLAKLPKYSQYRKRVPFIL